MAAPEGDDGGITTPETKVESNYESPVATGNVVWSANPTNDEVAYIDATSFTVQTVQTGEGPTYLAAVPAPTGSTDDIAIVQNAVSQDATLLHRDSQGNIATTTFASTADANSWAISPSGHWAIAWTNAAFVTDPPPAPAQGFGNVAVMDLSSAPANGTGQSTVMAVGYRPSQVAFAGSGDATAYVVTQDGISQINLLASPPVTSAQFPLAASASTPSTPPGEAGSTADASSTAPDAAAFADAAASGSDASTDAGDASSLVDAGSTTVAQVEVAEAEALPPEEGDDAGAGSAPDVSFTPDGNYALVRQDGLAFITVISLSTGAATAIPLPSAPTDLDLAPSGAFALAVLRDTSTVAVLPIPGIVTDPAVTMIPIPGEIIGRAIVTPDNKTALLFTTVTTVSDSQLLTVLTLSPPSYRTIQLHEPVLAVFPTPDSNNAVVLHSVTPTTDPQMPAMNVLGAFSLVPIATTLPVQLVPVPAEPTSVAISAASDRVVISLRDDPTTTYGLDVGLFPSLQVISQTLASPPVAAGIVNGAGQGYAAQQYAEGRITFVDLYPPDGGAPGAALTITGFDLGARIVDGRDE